MCHPPIVLVEPCCIISDEVRAFSLKHPSNLWSPNQAVLFNCPTILGIPATFLILYKYS